MAGAQHAEQEQQTRAHDPIIGDERPDAIVPVAGSATWRPIPATRTGVGPGAVSR
jgi:hypothetical protein